MFIYCNLIKQKTINLSTEKNSKKAKNDSNKKTDTIVVAVI